MITALPTPPSRQDPANFNDRADTFLGALPLFQTEANQLQTDVNAKQLAAASSATNAAASELAAANTAGATIWVSGTTYAIGANRFSPVNFLTYRRKTAGAGTTDPSVDSTNWQLLTGLGDVSTTGNQTIAGVKNFSAAPVLESVVTGHGGVATNNTRYGASAFSNNTTGQANTAVGYFALNLNSTGVSNTAVGSNTLNVNTTGVVNTAVGADALNSNTTGGNNTAVGSRALNGNTSGNRNTAVGADALNSNTTGDNNTAVGYYALNTNTTFSNVSGLGQFSQVSASNQVQLGNSSTTTYVYGTVQNRSDLRDKADVRDTTLGLSFINALRPVDYKWDMRDDYLPEPPADLPVNPTPEQEEAYKTEIEAWLEAVKQENLVHDGSKKRNRYHHGLIAQEVKQLLDEQGIDFGGYQDHKLVGGNDVLSIGYDELIAPLIKAVQELTKKVEDLEQQLAIK